MNIGLKFGLLPMDAALLERPPGGRLVLVDCVTLWLRNLVCDPTPTRLQPQLSAFLERVPRLPGWAIVVSNEVNMGVIPIDALTRRYCDLAGHLHQALAAHCARVVLTVAGLSLVLKGQPL